MDEKKSKSVYVKWIPVFIILILLFAAIIAFGIWTAQRDAQRMAELRYEFDIIQSIIENPAAYQDEIERWGYQVSVLMPKEKPEDEALQHYYFNYYSHHLHYHHQHQQQYHHHHLWLLCPF